MEKPKPMDRLICGDVGFGKTEVAIRAAFKAVMDGKQVAVLVPTTVLAQQHFNTFRERMADYPVRIELLSRFRTRRQQQRVVKDLANGAVDIVIGTHRLIQNDITFKDLGLVVIDEEQRFGVLHKEKFKRLRTLVDVLTLSATPIPRTLYLALTGARDMSTIQTPPHDRLPVETIVTQFDERVIRDAIQRELNRGGQVFFLHNRVMTIQTMADRLKRLLPHARIVVGHGQMDADELEEVMTKFVNGEADVLLSTTIIESGLDIPNANTIIIDRADRFGLSDLVPVARARRALQAPGLRVSAVAAPREPAHRRAQTHQRHPAILHARQRLQNRHARPGNPRRGQSARRGTKRPYHRRRFRTLLPVAQAKRFVAQGREGETARGSQCETGFFGSVSSQQSAVNSDRQRLRSATDYGLTDCRACPTTTSPNRSIASKSIANSRRPTDKSALETFAEGIARPVWPAAAAGGIAAARGRTENSGRRKIRDRHRSEG